VICATCGAEARPGQRFCGSCGSRLDRACSNCGAVLEPGLKFCVECGTAVAATSDAVPGTATAAGPAATTGADHPSATRSPLAEHIAEPVAERRLVSILFCDLVGFTEASEQRDPEETRDLLSRYYELARERVARYGGTIEKFVGDAVMAVWGVPTGHEDDAERAVRAGLELVKAVPALAGGGPDLGARAAILTGETAVTIGAEGQGMVAGDLVNTAARLQAAADPGTVLCGETTVHAARRAVAFEPVGVKTLKGKSLPVPAWRAVRVVAMLGGRFAQDELEPPFVGRDPELRLMDELFRASARERRLRLVSVTGQAGIGKSRLAHEFEKLIDGLVETVYWHQGRCPAYGEGVTFWALAEMVRRRCQIVEGDDEATSGARIRATLAEHVSDPDERMRIEPALRMLLGLETMERGAGELGELFVLWRTFFERIAEPASAVMVFEDLQWADDGLIEFIQHLLDWSRSSPILVVTLARPEFLDRRPTWGAGLRNFTSLHLEPLPETEMRRMLDGLVPGLPPAARATIVERAEGVPLYAVETVRMLLAQGVLERSDTGFRLTKPIDRLTVPDTLRGLVAARLDGLDPATRVLLQQASVLGNSLTLEALGAVVAQPIDALRSPLAELAGRELLRLESDPRSPERGQYRFVQSVIREVAYATLARRDRVGRHVAAARYFETLGDESLAGVLAEHYTEAWRSATDGAERAALAAQARVALRAAADRAARLLAFAQSAAYLERALEVTPDDAERAQLHERIGDSNHAMLLHEDEARSHFEAARGWAAARGDRATLSRLAAKIGGSFLNELRTGEARAVLEPAWREAGEHLADDPAIIALASALARALSIDGELERALAIVDPVIEAADRLELDELFVQGLVTRGTALSQSGRGEGEAVLRGAITIAHRYGISQAELRAMNNLGAWLEQTDPSAVLELALDLIELCERTGRDPRQARAGLVREWTERGRLADASALAEELAVDNVDVSGSTLQLDIRVLAALRGDTEKHDAMAAANLVAGMSGDFRTSHFGELARCETILGRLERARASRLQILGEESVSSLRVHASAGVASLLLRDAGTATAARSSIAENPMRHSLPRRAYLETLDAGLAALAGRRREATTLFRDALATWRLTGLLVEPSIAAVTFRSLVGPDEPEAAEAESELRARWEPLGAPGFMAFIDRETAKPPAPAHEAGNVSGAPKTEGRAAVGAPPTRQT
jgi:class 3 adenylate cyclase/tetratricopeptide (TPR) repeat protein